jgi:cytochrome c-type biogenesis protein CcsB
MKDLLETLASLKVVVPVIVLLLLGLVAGTIVESFHGAEAAVSTVYHTWWLLGILLLFGACTVASLIVLYPWGRKRIGYATTHSAIALILLGAVVTYQRGLEGEVQIWQGESSNEVIKYNAQGEVTRRITLPFALALEDFEVERYPGTEQPAGYRSHVRVIHPDGTTFDAGIWMNHELSLLDWQFYQSRYRIEEGRVATVLLASRDPGRPLVFLGYALLLVGLCIVLATRVAEARLRAARQAHPRELGDERYALGLGLATLLALVAGIVTSTGPRSSDATTETVRRLPVQHDGRVMPFDTFARETVRQVTGKRTWRADDPAATVLSWMFDASKALSAPLLPIEDPELPQALGLAGPRRHVSALEYENHRAKLETFFQRTLAAGADHVKLRAAADRLELRLVALKHTVSREFLRCMPAADGTDTWTAPTFTSLDALVEFAKGSRPAAWPSASAIERELTYNHWQPTRLAWLLLAGACMLTGLGWLRRSITLRWLALAGLLSGFGVMTWGIVLRWQIAGRIPASNMYESLLFLAWGVGFVALLLLPWMRSRLVLLNACGLSALTLGLADLLPIDSFIHPMPPVLSGTPWLAIHVPIIMLSYSILALGVVVAHVQIAMAAWAPSRQGAIKSASRILYWYIHVGCLLLTAGIVTGSIWAASSWGRYWGWDPKEVWSLVALLAYLALLHARRERWLKPFTFAAVSILAFQAILMTYLGVNFVLGTGLHSYAMGDSPVASWLVLIAALEIAFLFFAVAARRNEARA